MARSLEIRGARQRSAIVGATNIDRPNNIQGDRTMTTAAPKFSPQILGETEKALNAILNRLLAGTGVTEPQWITLSVTMANGGSIAQDALVGRVAGVFKTGEAQAQAQIAGLADLDLVQVSDATVQATDAGQQLHGRTRTATVEITQRLWGDLPQEDLAATARVLSTALARAEAEFEAI
jgi:hypothetical protein